MDFKSYIVAIWEDGIDGDLFGCVLEYFSNFFGVTVWSRSTGRSSRIHPFLSHQGNSLGFGLQELIVEIREDGIY